MTTQQDSVDVERLQGRFWLIVHEPGMVPERKGSWPVTDTAKVLREFIAARPAAYLHVLTIGPDGAPDVNHGPEVLQMLDGRSMSVGRKHNASALAAHTAALSLPITQRDEQGGVWRGIADAPRDGTEIVGWDEASGTRHVTSWDHGRWHDPDSHYYSEAPVFEPTLFCTLPHLSIKQGDQDGGTSA